jgi:hypothetical protein
MERLNREESPEQVIKRKELFFQEETLKRVSKADWNRIAYFWMGSLITFTGVYAFMLNKFKFRKITRYIAMYPIMVFSWLWITKFFAWDYPLLRISTGQIFLISDEEYLNNKDKHKIL